MTISTVFEQCVKAIDEKQLITRETSMDKEFHFQNWFAARLLQTGLKFEKGARNSYPDYRMVASPDGFELKGLAYPGRTSSFDSNSQIATGGHNGRTIYYVFGRYPKQPDGNKYPVLDLVICHGDFLNSDHDYKHRNKNVKGFGSYGDILIRDRKMYVVPTPFYLVDGLAHQETLILPSDLILGEPFVDIGELRRFESKDLVVAYEFNLQTNSIEVETIENPHAGRMHSFRAWGLRSSRCGSVSMREVDRVSLEAEVLIASDEDAG